MKRFFFTVIALAAVAVGCTKSGILESPQTYESPISFEPYTGKAPVTKATIENNTTITSGFRVIGFVETTADNDFDVANPYLRKFVRFGDHDGDKATAETPTPDTWFYSGAMYWPEGKELTFVAYGLNVNGTPAEALKDSKYFEGDADKVTGDVKFAQDASDYTSYTYTVGATAADHKDLVISPALPNCKSSDPSGDGPAATTNGDKVVNIRLYHVLSRIGFKLAVDNDYVVKDGESTTPGYSNRAITIHNVSLTGNFINNGTFNLTSAVSVSGETITYGTVGGDATPTTYSLFSEGQSFMHTPNGAESSAHPIYDNTDDAAENADDDRYMMIIPGDPGDDAIVTVSYQIAGGERTSVNLPLSNDLVFAAGKAYEFVFTVSNVAVGFDVDVTDWNTDRNADGKTDDKDDIPNNIN